MIGIVRNVITKILLEEENVIAVRPKRQLIVNLAIVLSQQPNLFGKNLQIIVV